MRFMLPVFTLTILVVMTGPAAAQQNKKDENRKRIAEIQKEIRELKERIDKLAGELNKLQAAENPLEPKKKKSPVVRVLKGWSLEKLGGDEESFPGRRLMEWPGVGVWPPVGVVYKSLDEVARAYPDKKFLEKLDKEVDFSENILLRYSWKGAGPPVCYRVWDRVWDSKEGPFLIFTRNEFRWGYDSPGSVELIIPKDVFKRSAERDRSADFRLPPD